MNNIRDIKDKKRIIKILAVMMLLNVLYFVTNKLNMQVFSPITIIDDLIPFVPIMIVPYNLWYIYIWSVYIYLIFKDEDLFFVHTKAVIISKTICVFIFLLFPTFVTRPEITQTDIFSKLVQATYNSDNPVNALPSIHVLESILTHIAILNMKNTKKWIKTSSLVYVILVIMSTLMVKQHYFLDAVAGLVVAMVGIKVAYSVNSRESILKSVRAASSDSK